MKNLYLFQDQDNERFYVKCKNLKIVKFAEQQYKAIAIAGPLPDKYQLINPYSINTLKGEAVQYISITETKTQ